MLEMLAERRGEIDAAVVAAFGDPGLGGARELFDFPGHWAWPRRAMLVARTLGRSFAIVFLALAFEPWFAEIVAWHRPVRTLRRHPNPGRGVSSRSRTSGKRRKPCWSIWLRTVTNDAADVVILAGAPLAGLANKICDRVPVPLVDGIQAATVMAGFVRPGRARRPPTFQARSGRTRRARLRPCRRDRSP